MEGLKSQSKLWHTMLKSGHEWKELPTSQCSEEVNKKLLAVLSFAAVCSSCCSSVL